MTVGEFEKEPYDEFQVKLSYDDVLADSETLSAVTLAAFDSEDDTDVTGTVLASAAATLLSGTATGGSTGSLIDTTKNFAQLGVKPGDKLYNSTKKRAVVVKAISTTMNAYDTLEFDAVPVAFAGSDAYAFLFAKASVLAGSDGSDYEIRYRATTSLSRKLEDSVLMIVRDRQ